LHISRRPGCIWRRLIDHWRRPISGWVWRRTGCALVNVIAVACIVAAMVVIGATCIEGCRQRVATCIVAACMVATCIVAACMVACIVAACMVGACIGAIRIAAIPCGHPLPVGGCFYGSSFREAVLISNPTVGSPDAYNTYRHPSIEGGVRPPLWMDVWKLGRKQENHMQDLRSNGFLGNPTIERPY